MLNNEAPKPVLNLPVLSAHWSRLAFERNICLSSVPQAKAEFDSTSAQGGALGSATLPFSFQLCHVWIPPLPSPEREQPMYSPIAFREFSEDE